MSAERAALVAGILAAPGDDAPRLVCADWFQEQGDPASVARAEFIRTQVERARLAPNDPRQSALYAQELRLLKAHGAAWAGSHFAFKKCRFRRGFIEYVHIHLRHYLFHRRQLLALEPVRDVSFTGWMRAKQDLVSRVAACEELKHLDTLRVHHQGPHKDARSPLARLIESPHLTGLRALRLSRLSITKAARQRLERAPVMRRLRELTLPQLDTYPDDAGQWLGDGGRVEPWEHLRVLRLRDYSVRPELLARLTAMPFWNRLEELDVNIGWNRAPDIAGLRAALPDTLRVLRLCGGSPWEGGGAMGAVFARAAQLPLRGLHVTGIPLEPEWLKRVFGPSSRCELEELTLSGCGLKAEHVRVLAKSPKVRSVAVLGLSHNWQLPPKAVESLFASENLCGVARLDLSNTPIGAGGANALAASEWDRLRTVSMVGSGLRTPDLRAALGSTAFAGVASLSYFEDSSSPMFTVKCVEALRDLPHLECLKLELSRKLDPKVRAALKAKSAPAWTLFDPGRRENWGNYDPNVLPALDDELAHVDQAS